MTTPNPTSLTFDLPYPPSVNTYWRRVGSRTLISREGRRYRGVVAAAVIEALGLPIPSLGEQPLEVTILVTPPDHRRRDLDNILKALLDALQGVGLFQDDSQIAVIRIHRKEAEPPGHVDVTLRVVSPQDATMAEKPTSAGTGQKRCAGRSQRPLS